MIRLGLLLALMSAPAIAATFGELEPAQGTWRVYRGTTFVCSRDSEQAAKDCAAADAEARRTTTRYQIRYPNRYGTATYTPQAPVNCVVSAWSDWTGGQWSACANGTQTRQETHTRTIVTQPANGGTACPVLTETRTATQACTVEPPPTGDWTHCANQGDTICGDPVGAYTGTRTVRFVADTRWVERELSSGGICNSTTFGGINPAPGALKTCQVRAGTSEPPPPPDPPSTGTGTALLNWTPSAQNVDGTPATLTGFRIRYGRSADSLNQVAEVGPVTTYTVTALASGTWYFGVAAVSGIGESAVSNIASKVVP
jgi:hypothetical protein